MVSTNVSQTAHDKIAVIGKKARAASLIMAKASSKQKNNVLLTLTDLLGKNLEDLLKANNLDIVEAEKNGLSKAFIDRLTISVDTVAQMGCRTSPDRLFERPDRRNHRCSSAAERH